MSPEPAPASPRADRPSSKGVRSLLCLGIGAMIAGTAMFAAPRLGAHTAAPLPPAAAAAPSTSAAAAPLPATARPAPVPSSAATAPAMPRSAPTRLRIPSIKVDAPFTGLTLDQSGALNAPPVDDKNLVGWYQDGVAPGEDGTSVVVGHVDTKTGPAVFLLLSSLKPGNTVDIGRADGSTATFAVDAVKAFAKNAFPDQEVYGQAADPELRLITCGGAYDKTRKDYTDNVVVFAHLQSSKPAAG
ncbi:class F sortase [Kitasatospora sp. NPDC059571]|uniref:class F sortase n=1 Tax=Kitasatospora sp. NPDC059571 TaxID=3346871 RepID=UPI0036754EF7